MKIIASKQNKFKIHLDDVWMVVTPAPEYEVFMDDDLKGDYVTTPEPDGTDFLDKDGNEVTYTAELYMKVKTFMNNYFADITPGEYNCSLDAFVSDGNFEFKNVKYERVADSEYLDYDEDDWEDYYESGEFLNYPKEDFPGGDYPAIAYELYGDIDED